MGTNENRAKYKRDHLRYPSDLTDEEWAHVEPLIPPARRGGRRRETDMRDALNAVMYVLSTGCQWRYLPKDLPPRIARRGIEVILCESGGRGFEIAAQNLNRAVVSAGNIWESAKGAHACLAARLRVGWAVDRLPPPCFRAKGKAWSRARRPAHLPRFRCSQPIRARPDP